MPYIVKYAELMNRFPVVVFEPDTTSKLLNNLKNVVGEDAIHIRRGKERGADIPADVKYIYTTVPLKEIKIPLLVTSAGMMFGGDKSLMLQNTEKAIYFAHEVYTSKKEYKVPEFGNNLDE